MFSGPSLLLGKEILSLRQKERNGVPSLGVPLGGGGHALPGGASDHTPRHGPEFAVPSLDLQPESGVPAHPMPVGEGGPSPQTEASDPRAAPQAGGKGRWTEAGVQGLALLIADEGLGRGAEGGARCFEVVHLIGETGGKGNPATLQF